MAIKINGKDLQKRIINGVEVSKVMENGVQIRPDSTPPTPVDNYFYFETTHNQDLSLQSYGGHQIPSLEISTNKTDWSDWDGSRIRIHATKLYIRNKSETPTGFNTSSAYSRFYTHNSGQYNIGGDIGYLLCKNSTNTVSSYCFYNLFSGCDALVNSLVLLPATTLAEGCYRDMFSGCRRLTNAPLLPATTLAPYCYYKMFHGCSSLTTGPSTLPATTLAPYCYTYMFSESNVITAPSLPATTLAPYCYAFMFSGVGLVNAPSLPATTLTNGCYRGMFAYSSVSSIPELLATTPASKCYELMFYYCSNIKVSQTQEGEYQNEFRILSGAAQTLYMLDSTGGPYWGNSGGYVPTGTYYTSNPVV